MLNEVSIEEQAFNAENVTFGDDRLGVMFYLKTVEDQERTMAEGRKCFRDAEYVKVMVAGERLPAADREVQRTGILPSDDRMRWPKQYARFKTQQEQPAHEGTPLGLWPGLPGALVEELKFLNIYTVEQLAELNDTHVGKIPNGQLLKRKAAEFITALKDQSQVNKLQAQLAERDNRIDTLEQAIKDQAARIDALTSEQASAKRQR